MLHRPMCYDPTLSGVEVARPHVAGVGVLLPDAVRVLGYCWPYVVEGWGTAGLQCEVLARWGTASLGDISELKKCNSKL